MSGRTVLITGASKGIGRATALYLAQQGYSVYAGVRKQADADSLASEAQGTLIPLLLDVTDSAQIEQACARLTGELGTRGLDALVNNAGIAVAAPLEYLPPDDLRWQFEVNLFGPMVMTQAFLPLLRQAKGRLLNVSSIGGRMSTPFVGAYHGSKFAMEAMSDSLRVELAPAGVEVILIEPGTIATPIWENSSGVSDRLLSSEQGSEITARYGVPIEALRRTSVRSMKTGISPVKVAEVIARAISAPRPRTRYLVGTDAFFIAHVISHLPDRWRDRLFARMYWNG